MKNNIQIIEKPDWISWDDIKKCLFDAHIINREKGINMANYQWPAEKIKESIGDNGVMFVALDGDKLVGTAALAEKKSYHWYSKGKCGYLCFACVIPSYSGLGIYHSLLKIFLFLHYQRIYFQNNYILFLYLYISYILL